MLNIENMESKFESIINSDSWKRLEKEFKDKTNIFLIGNGGNLAIADHAAIDISRLTDKNAMSPGSGITSTSIIGDKNAESWLKTWIDYRSRGINAKDSMVIGFSCSTSGTSSNAIVDALQYAVDLGMSAAIISAQPKKDLNDSIIGVSQDVSLYHTSEILSLTLTYQLTHSAGFECPSVFKKSRQRSCEKLGIVSEIEGK